MYISVIKPEILGASLPHVLDVGEHQVHVGEPRTIDTYVCRYISLGIIQYLYAR